MPRENRKWRKENENVTIHWCDFVCFALLWFGFNRWVLFMRFSYERRTKGAQTHCRFLEKIRILFSVLFCDSSEFASYWSDVQWNEQFLSSQIYWLLFECNCKWNARQGRLSVYNVAHFMVMLMAIIISNYQFKRSPGVNKDEHSRTPLCASVPLTMLFHNKRTAIGNDNEDSNARRLTSAAHNRTSNRYFCENISIDYGHAVSWLLWTMQPNKFSGF